MNDHLIMLIVFGIFAALIAVGRVKGVLADPGQASDGGGFEDFLDGPSINPANGAPMTGAGVDIEGNPYGTSI